jgi:glycine C-acetyltransferase
MNTGKLDISLARELNDLQKQGRAKSLERNLEEYIPPRGKFGPRYKLVGNDNEFIRLNSNSYLSLSNHPHLMAASDKAIREFGVGPCAVRLLASTSKFFKLY